MRIRVLLPVLVVIALGLGTRLLFAQGGGEYTLSGRVFEDLNGNGRFDGGEPCVTSVVSLRPLAGGTARTATLICAQTPFYVFRNLPSGRYALTVAQTASPGYAAPTLTVNIPEDRQRDLPLSRQALQRVSGAVALDRNGNRYLDPGEPGLSEVRIDVVDPASNTVLGSVTTGAGGAFAFQVSQPGEYDLLERDPQGHVSTAAFGGSSGRARVLEASRIRIKLGPGQGADGLLFLNRSTAGRGIAGRALDDTNNDGLLSTQDTALPDVELRLLDTQGQVLAITRSMDDGSYFFDSPPAGRGVVISVVPPFGTEPAAALAGTGALPVGRSAILIPAVQAGTVYSENHFLLRRGAASNPLPAGPAEVQGVVFSLPLGRRIGEPLSGVTVLLRDAAGAVRAGATTAASGQFRISNLPIGSYTLTEVDPPGYVSGNAIPGQRGTRIDANTIRIDMVNGQTVYAGQQFIDQPGDSPGAVNAIEGMVTEDRGGTAAPLKDVVLLLLDSTRRVHSVTATDAAGRYRFQRLRTGVYRVVEADPPGYTGGNAVPGANATRIDANTLEIAMVAGVSLYAGNNFVEALSLAQDGLIERLVAVGDQVAATGRLAMFGTDPLAPDRQVSAIRQVTPDGAAYVADYAGASLMRFGAPRTGSAAAGTAGIQQAGTAAPEVLLDTTRLDPVDGAGLARLLRVETALNGVSGIVALRADNTRGIYRLSQGILTRLALLTDPAMTAEVAVSAAGQIAFVALTASGMPALFQTVGGQSVQVLGPGQVVRDSAGRVVLDGAQMERVRDVTSNAAGDLTCHISLAAVNNRRPQFVIRKTAQGLSLVAMTGQQVLPERNAPQTVELTGLGRPLIGPDGTIACRGTMGDALNFFVDGPRRRFQPMLPGRNWNRDETTFDYDVAADGSVALRAAPGTSQESGLYLVAPTGGVIEVQRPGDRIQPTGRPAFGPDSNAGLFFFLAKNLDGEPLRSGSVPVVLCRSRLIDGRPAVDAAAAPGEPVPGRAETRLLAITQRPVISGSTVTFGGLFGSAEPLAVPTAGLFRIPVGGTLADGTLLAEEGSALPGAERLAMLRLLSYTDGGTLLFGGLLPGAGSLVATAAPAGPVEPQPSALAAPSRFRTQATRATVVAPLLAIGQALDRPDRRLIALLGRLTALGSDQQLLVARFNQDGVGTGEGLFTLSRDGQVRAVAVTGDPVPGNAGARFAGFADTAAATLNPPAVSADASVVFKARLDRGGAAVDGVFRWTGSTLVTVGLSVPDPDNLAITADDVAPYALERWAAGPAARSYLLARHRTRSALQVARLFEHQETGLRPLVVPGLTPVAGAPPAPLTDLFDTVLNRAGGLFVSARSGATTGVMAFGPTGLTPLAAQGQPLPRFEDGSEASGFTFDGTFSLLPASARGELLFIAGVKTGADTIRRGLFRMDPVAGLRARLVEGLGVGSVREIQIDTLAASSILQTVNNTTAAAFRSNGRWQIIRTRVSVDAQGRITTAVATVAQEGQLLPGGGRIVTMDPAPLLDLAPNAGPVFTLNEAGEIAFLASDGQRWGVYLFRDGGL